MKKTYNKIQATLLAVETAVICASTLGVNTTPVEGSEGNEIEAGARGINSDLIIDFD